MAIRQQLLHFPLESYQNRYTADLAKWENAALGRLFSVQPVTLEESLSPSIVGSGEVLDVVGRPRHALAQTQKVLSSLPNVPRHWYFSDLYHPGLDALAYSRTEFSAGAYLWAQTFDQYDFTRQLHLNWMRPWEIMALEIYKAVFVASELLRDLIVTALPHTEGKIHVVGLPYNHTQVFTQLRSLPTSKQFDVVYTSRWDREKQPGLFLELVENNPDLKFAICTGLPSLTGSDQIAIEKAKELARTNKLTLCVGMPRAEYFAVLASSKVQFNCALQDWVSFTLLDALTFGCLPLYPAFRSFPEALCYDSDFLYTPGDMGDANYKLRQLLQKPPAQSQLLASQVLGYHDEALDRVAQIMEKL